MDMPKLVTIVGGSGFIGRQIAKDLAQAGVKVRIACRDPERALDLKPLGDVGQVTPIQANIRYPDTLRAAVKGADAVISLVGILAETGAQKFASVQAEGPRALATAAAEAGVKQFVHISAIGASADSPSQYASSKAAGEQGVRDAFPNAVILRPSVVFGPRDDFFNRFAAMAKTVPAMPLIGGGKTKFQPVYVGDVSKAVISALTDAETHGKTFELGGPQVFTFEELMWLVLHHTGRNAALVPLPFGLAMALGTVLGVLPKPPLTADQVILLKSDNVESGDFGNLQSLGIEPTAAHAVIPTYLDAHKKGGRYADWQG